MMNHLRIVIASLQSGSGKTTVSLGIMLALRKMGLSAQPFKAGPDYIDPLHHSAACLRISRNLDSWLMTPKAILESFTRNSIGADISVIEGVMGLYDGFRDTEYGSTGHLAKILGAPVILVLNAASFSRSAAAIVLGAKEFDKKVNLAGVILNNIGSPTHYHFAKSAIEQKTRIPVLGFLPKDLGIKLAERHLGLVPAGEKRINAGFYKRLSFLIEKNVDLRRILRISRKAPGLRQNKAFPAQLGLRKVTIALARDKAFNFYYQDNLDILKSLGVKLVEFSPLEDRILPEDIDGMYLGGGFPELFAERLAKNVRLRQEVNQRAQEGLPIYAECGGLMYLARRLVNFKKKSFPMAGIFKCSAIMGHKRQALGYIDIKVIKNNILSKSGDKIRAHTFHWSYLNNVPRDIEFAYKVTKYRDKVFYDGLIYKNVLASYAHLHFASNMSFAGTFVKSCLLFKGNR